MSRAVVKVFMDNEKRVKFKHLCSSPENVKNGKGDMQKTLEGYIDKCLAKGEIL